MDIARLDLIDEVIDYQPEAPSGVALSHVPHNHVLYEGHFPGHPVFPGNLQLEVMAQTAGLILLATDQTAEVAFLAGIDKARFRGHVNPGETLTSEVRSIYQNGRYSLFECTAKVSGNIRSSAHIRIFAATSAPLVTRDYIRAKLAKHFAPFQKNS
jgi:3-hydroxyacyl-[acyl-carrier-protein] dehydratase